MYVGLQCGTYVLSPFWRLEFRAGRLEFLKMFAPLNCIVLYRRRDFLHSCLYKARALRQKKLQHLRMKG